MATSSFYSNSSNKKNKEKDNPDSDSITEKKDKTEGESSGIVSDSQDQWFFRKALWILLAVVALMLFTFAAGFFITLQGNEKTVIPNVEKMELVDAILELQDKGLNTRLQVKYTENPDDKGRVVNQTPQSGQHVRIGRNITLTVSQGAIVENVGTYLGMTLEEVKLELQTIFASFQTLIQIGEVVYQYSDQPEGVIIAQDPSEGTAVTGLTSLNLVISRGMEEGLIKVGNYTGMNYMDVISTLAEEGIPFVFHIDDSAPSQGESIVFRQVPAIGEMVQSGTALEFYINPLSDRAIDNSGDNMIFDLFEYQVPRFLVPIPMRVEKKEGTTEPVVLFETLHSGGLISFPYLEEEGTSLSLFANNKEIIRYYVQEQ